MQETCALQARQICLALLNFLAALLKKLHCRFPQNSRIYRYTIAGPADTVHLTRCRQRLQRLQRLQS